MSHKMIHCKYSKKLMRKLYAMNFLHKKHNLPVANVTMIKKAIYFAKKYHHGQLRNTKQPFISHPITVANMCMDYIFNTNVIVAALLHDIVEDTSCTTEIIYKEFNYRIAEMVYRLTRIRHGKKISIEKILQEALDKNDRETIIIKIVDRIHNLQSINVKNQEKRLKTIRETLDYFVAFAVINSNEKLEEKINIMANKLSMPKHVTYLQKLYSKKISFDNYCLAPLT